MNGWHNFLGWSLSLFLGFIPLTNAWVFNNPYPASDAFKKIYYTSFTEQPKTLDPAKAYSNNEYLFVNQIYEPPLQYDYLQRPYQLIPLTATEMPVIEYFDKTGHKINKTDDNMVANTRYLLSIQPGVFFQPHPAFAKDGQGRFFYLSLDENYLNEQNIKQLSDFKQLGTRELIADDYIYGIKRLADPSVSSPIYGLMSEYIVGFKTFGTQLPNAKHGFVNLNTFPLSGLQKIDNYHFAITIQGQYQQFLFWLAMPFFAPIPWEVDKFYSQPGMEERNISFDWYPVGTGPFMLTENNPNSRMMLSKNPHYHYKNEGALGTAEDKQAGYLHYFGKKLPMIDRAVYTLEKESIPRWNKFLQGYYDLSGITTDSFDQVIRIDASGEPVLTPLMREKGLRLSRMNELATYYLGFNMQDPIVGGPSERARKLRLAISIAVNYEDYIALFYNGRGHAAQSPLPPGIFGAKEGELGINPFVFTWDGHKPKRRSIAEAKQLLAEAGYPNGVDKQTGQPLLLHYDVHTTGSPEENSQLDWMRKQFARIGIDLDVRSTQYNRFQEKMRTGNAQIYSWGWFADYPDPENFLFQFYSKNGKVKFGGENTSNYSNPRYDHLFDLMKNRDNDAKRQQLIDDMLRILRYDAPWAFGINTETFMLSQQWIAPIKWNAMSSNTLQYVAIDIPLRTEKRREWNTPIIWPIGLFFGLLCLLLLPFLVAYYKKQHSPAARLP